MRLGEALSRILGLVVQNVLPDGLINKNRVSLSTTLSVSGNPIRLDKGEALVDPDQKWTRKN